MDDVFHVCVCVLEKTSVYNKVESLWFDFVRLMVLEQRSPFH
jgi:hypothetical protein